MSSHGAGDSLWGCDAGDEPAQFRAAIPLIPQASLSNVLAMYEDMIAVNTIAAAHGIARPFDVRIVGETAEPFTGLSGATILPNGTMTAGDRFDCVLLPVLYDDGCLSDANYGPILAPVTLDWTRAQHAGGARFSMMCSASLALADTGLLDGHATSMFPLYAEAFRARFPDVTLPPNQTLIVSGDQGEFVSGGDSVYSSDVSLYTIRQHLGPEIALQFARLYCKAYDEVLYDMAAPHRVDVASSDRTVALAQHFMLSHLDAPSLVSATARMVNMSDRGFSRRFQRATGQPAREFVLDRRMERARSLLSESRIPIEEIAARVGYADRAAFAKAFKRKTGATPASYRAKFQVPANLRA